MEDINPIAKITASDEDRELLQQSIQASRTNTKKHGTLRGRDWLQQGTVTLPLSQQRLFHCIVKSYARNYYDLADRIGVTAQNLLDWRRRAGVVPVALVGPISRVLGVSPYALDYELLLSIAGKAPPWETVVRSTLKGQSDITVSWVLSGEPPRNTLVEPLTRRVYV